GLDQGADLEHGLLGIRPGRAHRELRPLGRGETQDRQHARPADPLLPAAEADLALETAGDRGEPARWPRMQPERGAHDEGLLDRAGLAHDCASGTSSLATEMLRWP